MNEQHGNTCTYIARLMRGLIVEMYSMDGGGCESLRLIDTHAFKVIHFHFAVTTLHGYIATWHYMAKQHLCSSVTCCIPAVQKNQQLEPVEKNPCAGNKYLRLYVKLYKVYERETRNYSANASTDNV